MSQADIVNTWFIEKIATGPIARDTPAYNQAFAAKDDLIARLEASSTTEPQPQPAAETAPEE